MPNEVELTLEVVTKNLEAFDEAAEGIESLSSPLEGLTADFIELNPELVKNKKDLADLLNVIGRGGQNLDAFGDEAKEAGDAVGDMGKKMETASSKTGGLEKGLKGIGKGLLGIATVYAGGRWLTKMTKDSLDSARVAGVAAKGFDSWDDAVDRLSVSFGTLVIGKGGDETAGFFARIADGLAGVFEIATLTNEELDKLGVERGRGTTYVIDIETGDILDANDLLERQAELLGGVSDRAGELADKFAQLESQSPFTSAAEAIKLRTIIPDISGQMAEEIEQSERLLNAFFADLTEGITDETRNILIGIEFEALGGDEILETFRLIQEGFATGALTREQARQFFGLQFAEEEGFKVIQGLQTRLDAIEEVADVLGLEQATILIDDFLAGADLISQLEVQAAIDTSDLLTGIKQSDLLLEKLDMINGKTVKAKVLVDLIPTRFGGEEEDF